MKDDTTSLGKAAIVGLIALAVVASGVAFAATPGTFDNETADSPETSQVQEGVVLDSTFNASGDATYNVTMHGANSSDLAMNVTLDNESKSYYTFDGSWTVVNDTAGNYQHNFTGADLSRVPMGANETADLDVHVWEVGDKANATVANVTVDNTWERSVQEVDASALDGGFAEITSSESWFGFGSNTSTMSVDQESVAVNGSNTTVIYTLPDSEAQDTIANATEGISSSGTWTLMKATVSDGDTTTKVPVFYDSAPDSWSVSDDGSYAVYDADADKLTYTLSEDQFGGADSVDVTFNTNKYGITDIYGVYKAFGSSFAWDLTASSVNPLSLGFGGLSGSLSLGLIIPFSRRRVGE